MKIIKYAYKFRLKPTDEQKILLNKHFGSVRWIYNYFLNQRKEEYLNNKKSLNYYGQAKELTQIKKQEDKIWLKEINTQSLQVSLNCLDTAYQSFFKKRTKFPKFKSKKSRNSFTVPQFMSVKKDNLINQNLEKV
jgi:putative transposase